MPRLPVPIADEILADLNKAKIFNSLGLVSGLFQCSIYEDSIPLLLQACTSSYLCRRGCPTVPDGSKM